jgi:aminodeoxyfutalosine deaminase
VSSPLSDGSGLFTGAGLSRAAPAGLPLGRAFHERLYEACYEAADRLEPGLVDRRLVDLVKKGPWNLLARLESTLAGSAAGALACMQIRIPNEAQMLAAVHLAHGGLHVTVNFDDGIECAYGLLSGDIPLPDDAPVAYREALPSWQACIPRRRALLRVLSEPADLASASFDDRPLLVKLHGSLGKFRDGIVLPLWPMPDDPEVIELDRGRGAALDVLADTPFVVVTGYSGNDLASSAPLVARLKRGRFAWVAPTVATDVRAALRAIDPKQPVAGRAVDAIWACLPVKPPAWPSERLPSPGFDQRLASWSATLPPRCAAEALAWILTDAGWHDEAIGLLTTLCADGTDSHTRVRLADALARRDEPGDRRSSSRIFLGAAARGADRDLRAYAVTRWAECRSRADAKSPSLAAIGLIASAVAAAGRRPAGPVHRARATSAAVGILLSGIERRLTTGGRSSPRRWALRVVAGLAASEVRRALGRTGHLPSGGRRALLRRQEVELTAVVALLGGPPPADAAFRSLGRLRRLHEHVADTRGVAEALGTQAIAWLAAGNPSRALSSFQEASRFHPASTGVLGTARDLLLQAGVRAERQHGSSDDAASESIAARSARRSRRPRDADPPGPLEAFVRALPKVELHVHLEGSVAPSTLAALARRADDCRVPWAAEDVERWYRYRSYTDFLNAYVLVCDQLRTGEDFARVTTELGERLAGQNVRYAEVTFSPVAHVRRGISPGELFAALEHGRRQAEAAHDVELRWCVASGTRRGPAAALETIEMALAHHSPGVVSLGLAGLETVATRAHFAPAFELARAAGLHAVAHAGEAAGPASIWEAIDVLGAERIGHGIRCLEDPALVAQLRRSAIPLEVCPTSNVRTRLVSSLRAHPLPRLLAEGLCLNLNTDDPAMFHTDLNCEYVEVARAFGLGPTTLAEFARSGVRSAFLAPAHAEALVAEIDSVPVPHERVRAGQLSVAA